MGDESDSTFEARVLARYPRIRETVLDSEAFISWRESLSSVVVDDERLYIRGGDMLKDEDQIIFEWARKQGLLSDEMIRRDNGRDLSEADRRDSL